MPKKGGRRVQIKKIQFQIKEALLSSQDPLPLFMKLHNLDDNLNEPKPNIKENINYKLTPIEIKHKYPNYKSMKRFDPRYKIYKIRELFGPELIEQIHELNVS